MEYCILLVVRRKNWGIRNVKICLSSTPHAVPTHEAERVGVPANLALNYHGNLIKLASSEAETGRSAILSSFSTSTCGSYWHASVWTLHLPIQKGLPPGENPPYFGFIGQEMTPLSVLISWFSYWENLVICIPTVSLPFLGNLIIYLNNHMLMVVLFPSLSKDWSKTPLLCVQFLFSCCQYITKNQNSPWSGAYHSFNSDKNRHRIKSQNHWHAA